MNTVTLKDQTMADSMREFADWLDANPEVAALVTEDLRLYIFSYEEDEFRNINRLLGNFDKVADGYGLEALKKFGRITLKHSISHEAVCEKKVVGTTIVKQMIPAHPVPEVEMIEIEVEEEITEWICPETWR